MTDRELIALMAASILPGVDGAESTLTIEAIAVNIAIDLLAAVDRKLIPKEDLKNG